MDIEAEQRIPLKKRKVGSAPPAPPPPPPPRRCCCSLGTFHALLSWYHLALAITCFLLPIWISDPHLSVGLRHYVSPPNNQTSIYESLVWEDVGSMSLKYMAGACFLITSVSHALQAYLFNNREDKWWERFLRERRLNPIRWVEYTCSVAPLMTVTLGALMGNRNILDYLTRGGCTAAMMMCGYLGELTYTIRRPDVFRGGVIYLMGCLFGILPFIQDMVLLGKGPSLPLFVIGIIVSTYAFFFIFGVWGGIELFFGQTRWDYLYTDGVYAFLSGTSKAVLGLYVAFSVR